MSNQVVFSKSGHALEGSRRVRVMVDREELLSRLAGFRQMWVNGLASCDDMSSVTVDLNLFFDDLVNLLGLVDRQEEEEV